MKRLMALITIVISATTLASPAKALPANPAELAAVYLDFMHSTSAQSEQLWPGFRLEDKVQFISLDGNVWLQRPHGQIIQDNQLLSTVNLQTGLALNVGFPDYQGQPSVLLQVEQPEKVFGADALTDVGILTWAGNSIHEAFHFYGQSEWPVLEQQVLLKGEVYPLNQNARFARSQLFQYLLTALTHPAERQANLAQAAYWLQHWRNIAPLEDQVGFANDLIEGSAAYVALMSGVHLVKDAALTDDNEALATQFIADYFAKAHQLGWDSEAQDIGAVTGVLLDAIQGPLQWKDAAMEGVLPLDMLLGQINAAAPDDQANPNLAAKVQNQFDYYAETNQSLAGLLASVDNPSMPMLVLPSLTDSAVFLDTGKIRSGFYIVPYQDGVVQAFLGVNTQFDNLNFMSSNVLELLNQNFCDGLDSVTLVPVTGLHHVENGFLVMEQADVQGMIRVIPTQVDGRILYCAVL